MAEDQSSSNKARKPKREAEGDGVDIDFLVVAGQTAPNAEAIVLGTMDFYSEKPDIDSGIPFLSPQSTRDLSSALNSLGFSEGTIDQRINSYSQDYVRRYPDIQERAPAPPQDISDDYKPNIPYTPGGYTIAVQQTALTTKSNGQDVSEGRIFITDPEGNVQSFDFISGGYGKGPLPGLDRSNMSSMEYDLNWSSFVVNGYGLPKGMKDSSGRGCWLKIGAGRGEANDPSRGGFGIHTDGNVPGSLGCIVLEPAAARELFNVLESIPEDMRPPAMSVLPPSDIYKPEMTLASKLETPELS